MKTTTTPMTLGILVVTASLALAASTPSSEQGKILFGSTNLGTNGRSCATCHPDGKGLSEAAGYDGSALVTISNQCIRKALKGRELAPESTEMKSLVMYLQSLADRGKK